MRPSTSNENLPIFVYLFLPILQPIHPWPIWRGDLMFWGMSTLLDLRLGDPWVELLLRVESVEGGAHDMVF
jgi:hypothetical protein